MSLKEKIYNELKSCPSLQAMIDTLQDATTPGGSLTPGWLTKKFGRGEPMTFEQADNGKTNPYYQKGVINGYNENCITTVLAFEARLRGYNVEARPYSGRDLGIIGTPNWLCDHSSDLFKKNNVKIEFSTGCTTANKAIKFLDETIIMGARYVLNVAWKKSKYGHSMVAYKDELGNVVVYCPQTNKFYDDNKKLKELFGDVKSFTYDHYGRKCLKFYLTRLDKLPFDREMMGKLFAKAGETK